MSRDLLDLVRELNTLNDDNLADRVIENSDVQWCLSELQDILEEMSTLTPPNEPLTLDELLKMDGEPVWVDDKKTWALLQVWDDKNIDVVFPMPKGCFHAKSVNGRKIYRRPPEGEEET